MWGVSFEIEAGRHGGASGNLTTWEEDDIRVLWLVVDDPEFGRTLEDGSTIGEEKSEAEEEGNPKGQHSPSSHAFSGTVREITVFPTTIQSIAVRSKQAIASAGVRTTGSFSLSEVFRRMGTPVFSWNFEIRAW